MFAAVHTGSPTQSPGTHVFGNTHVSMPGHAGKPVPQVCDVVVEHVPLPQFAGVEQLVFGLFEQRIGHWLSRKHWKPPFMHTPGTQSPD